MRKNEIPKKPRFNITTKKAYEMLAQLEIGGFPVNPYKIIEYFPNWKLCSWSELKFNTGENDPFFLDRDKAEARTVKYRDSKTYLIIFDDRINNQQRIRWSIAHEIAHIILGHLDDFDATALNRRGLTKSEYGVLEVEANHFAAELLSPKTILRRVVFEDMVQGISMLCDISREASEKRVAALAQQDFAYYKEENIILRNFYRHLFQGAYLQSMHDTARKFQYAPFYSDLCKESRICKKCNQFIEEANYSFCPACGTKLIDSRLKMSKEDTLYGNEYRQMAAVKEFADKHKICLLFVHHLRKMADESDVFNMISGSTALMGATDTILIISKKKRNDDKATFSSTGRDIEQGELVVAFDKSKYKWEVEGTPEEVAARREIEEYESNIKVQVKEKRKSNGKTNGWSFSKV